MNLFDYERIMHAGHSLISYVVDGCEPGGFLGAVLSNDLKSAFECADHINAELVGIYVCWLVNYAPSSCWGSREAYKAWLDKGGMRGMVRAGEYCEDLMEEFPTKAWRSLGERMPK